MNLSNFITGQLSLEITAPFPQRLLNLAAQEHILFWGLVWEDNTHITLVIRPRDFPRLQNLAQKMGGDVKKKETKGLPAIASRFRHRVGFLLGFALSLLAVLFLSQFILVIDIEGNQTVHTATIRSALEKAGLHVGVYGPSLSLSQLPQGVLADLDGVAWMSINLYGTRAVVEVTEAVPPPDIFPTQGLSDIIATVGGIVEEVQAYKGQAMVKTGDTVAQGQVLIRGNVELEVPLYSEDPPLWLQVPSSGKIIARTWHSTTAVIPLTAQVKVPYGVAKNSFTLSLFGERWTFFENNMIFLENYDKLSTSNYLPRLEELPLVFAHTTQTPYQLEETALNQRVGQELLEEALLEHLQQQLGDTGEILTTDFVTETTEGLLKVTLLAECRQSIGLTVPGTLYQPEELPPTE